MRAFWLFLILSAVMVLYGIGCREVKEPQVAPVISLPVEDNKPKMIPDNYEPAPLTGILTNPDQLALRPVAVMVENAPAARPQSGLLNADVVYEVLAEGGITRFLAVYQSKDTKNVGPVRSARPYYVERALEYDALYAHCGGSEDAKRFLKTTKTADMDEFGIGRKGQAFWRIKSRKAPHNLYGNTANIRSVGLERGYRSSVKVPAFKFLEESEAVPEGEAAQEVIINYPRSYSVVTYKYQPELNLYLRYNGAKAHKDADNGEQLGASNILVQFTNTKIIDSEGRLRVQMTGSGKALLFLGGKKFAGTWDKSSSRAWTTFRDEQGREFKLLPGQTWIQVVPIKTKIDYN